MNWLLNFIPGFSQVKWLVYLGLGIVVGVGSFYLGWREKGLRDDVLLSSTQKEFDNYKLGVAQDAAVANHNVIVEMEKQFSYLQQLQTKLRDQAKLNTQTSNELLKRLSQREDSNDTVCPSDAAYLDQLRQIENSRIK